MYMDGSGAYCGNRTELTAFAGFGDLEAIEGAILRAILRGEQPIETLKETTIRVCANRVYRDTPTAADVFLSLGSADIAEGLLNLKHDPAALADWARFILITSDHLTFNDRHTDYCDRLLSTIWDIAFGKPVRETAIRLAQSICTRFGSR